MTFVRSFFMISNDCMSTECCVFSAYCLLCNACDEGNEGQDRLPIDKKSQVRFCSPLSDDVNVGGVLQMRFNQNLQGCLVK